jgi:outer membrane receptor protein involved in Fe transport
MKQAISQLCVWMLLCVSLALSGTTGKLAGRITDSQTGEPILGANVTLGSTKLGASTDNDGYYHIIEIPPGTYEVTISCIGYKRSDQRVMIKVDLTTTLNIPMTPQAVELPEVLVSAERVVIQRDQSSTIQKTNADDLETMPTNTLTGVLQLQTGVVNTGSLHVRGGRSGEVGYYLDGYRVEDPLFNGQVIEINNRAIQEMELLSGTFNAEYGNALSGIVNIVTKENVGIPHANLLYKRSNLGIEEASNNLNEQYYEGTVSGPLWSGSPIGLLISGKKVNADSYYFSGRADTAGGTKKSIEFSKDKPYGFNDLLSTVGKLSWAPFGSAKITLLDNYSKRRWRSYSHSMRFIPDSTYINTSESNLL